MKKLVSLILLIAASAFGILAHAEKFDFYYVPWKNMNFEYFIIAVR
ncbi:MAG: hypothetical protein K2M06_07600 [Muribaculaceae bacterium]|nr:hypothetical protein [Muribaculaceae bacterium]